MTEKLENYVIFKREIATKFRDREITKNEFDIYCWLRLNANPYGISITSLSDINDDLFYSKNSNNNINKILSSLKKKRLIFYKKRKGERGSFNIHFADFIVPKSKGLTKLDKLFDEEDGKTSPNSEGISQKLDELKSDIAQMVSKSSINIEVPTSNTNTDNKKEIDITRPRKWVPDSSYFLQRKVF
jgi:hypothetical protein